MRLSVLTDLTGAITRQTLQDIWTDAAIADVQASDFSADTLSVQVGSSLSEASGSPTPGTLFFSKGEQLMYCYHDEIDGTGVSLWLAIGPDVFECACLAGEPIPAGAVVSPWFDRRVFLGNASNASLIAGQNRPTYIGVNQSGLPPVNTFYVEGETAQSGAWIRVAIDGLPRVCYPAPDTGVSTQHFGNSGRFNGTHHQGVLGGPRFGGLIGAPNNGNLTCDSNIGQSCFFVSNYSGMTYTYARVKWGGGARFIV